MNNGGIIWLTDFPYIEQPIFKMSYNILDFKKELYTSDWCADPYYFKVNTYYAHIIFINTCKLHVEI